MTETESGIAIPDGADVDPLAEVDPLATTTGGLKLPYPLPTDPVAGGAAAIQALATAVERDLSLWTFVAAPALGQRQTDNYGFKSTGQSCYLPWSAIKAAGLFWQIRLIGEHWSNQANQYSNIRVTYDYLPNAGAAVVAGGALWTSAINPAPTSPMLVDSGWQGFSPGASADAYLGVRFSVQTSADNTGQLTYSIVNLLARLQAL